MLMAQTEGYFENLEYHFLEEPVFSVGFKMKALRKSISQYLDKNQPKFCCKTC